jgi:hypothetical protein
VSPDVKVVRNPSNVGVYPLFEQGLALAGKHDILAFIHSDLLIYEVGWDVTVRDAFARDDQLGLLGFVGSSQIDASGGRGLGTMSNFQGHKQGSSAEAHGVRITGYRPAAVLDGCVLIFRRATLQENGFRSDFPPHHFYDRLISCQVLERGWRMAVHGIACADLGEHTAVREQAYHAPATQWVKARDTPMLVDNADLAVYREGERQFLTEWRDEKRFIPLTVGEDWRITHR